MRTLITGGAGFIGLHLARRLLRDGGEVVLVDNFQRAVHDQDLTSVTRDERCSMVEIDLLCDPLPSMEVDAIVHLAAVVGVSNVVQQPYSVLRSNVDTLLRVIDWATGLSGLRQFVFASTSEVYAGSVGLGWAKVPTPEVSPLAIVDPCDPRATYLLSKIYGEALCAHAGLPYTVIRPHNLYGPRMGMSHVIPQLLKKAWMAEPGSAIEVASIQHTRTFLFIDDAVDYLVKLLERPGTGEVLNLGNQGPEISVGELAAMVISTVGKDLSIIELPPTAGSPARRAPDTEGLSRALGVTAGIPLSDGIARTYRWYRANVFAPSEATDS